jgi:two-component system chemotaxis response regulator CheB
VKLLLVEDSRSVVAFLEQLLRREPDIELLPAVSNGRDAVAAVQRWSPHLVLMDLVLPGMDGVDAIAEIMATAPCPIVVLSAQLDTPGRDRTFESLTAGAVDVLAKPLGGGVEAVREFRERLLRTVRMMAHARVVGRRRPSTRLPTVARGPSGGAAREGRACALLAIGGSTGAPPLVYELLRALPAPAPFPVVVAQHIVHGFEPGFVTWLKGTGHRAEVATGGEWLEAGVVYVSPSDRDLVVSGGQLRMQHSRGGGGALGGRALRERGGVLRGQGRGPVADGDGGRRGAGAAGDATGGSLDGGAGQRELRGGWDAGNGEAAGRGEPDPHPPGDALVDDLAGEAELGVKGFGESVPPGKVSKDSTANGTRAVVGETGGAARNPVLLRTCGWPARCNAPAWRATAMRRGRGWAGR